MVTKMKNVIEISMNTKDQIAEYLNKKTKELDMQDFDAFTTNMIAEEMHISRTIASQYLNQLVEEGCAFKVKSRPVYFFNTRVIEEKYRVPVKKMDFLDISDMVAYLSTSDRIPNVFEKLIGYDGSLRRAIRQSIEVFNYPPAGLPLLIYGNEGCGKKTLAEMICRQSKLGSGILHRDCEVILVELSKDPSSSVNARKLMQQRMDRETVFIIQHIENVSNELLKYVFTYCESAVNRKLHFLFLSNEKPGDYLNKEFARFIPVSVHLHDFDERPKEEREGIVVNLFQKEAAKFKASIEISSNVLRILAAASFDDNIVGLAKVIRLTCAKASSGMQDGRIRIHTYDLPDRQLEKIEISDRNVEYLDCSQYKVGSEVDQYLELFNIILQTCKMGSKTDISKAFKGIYTTIGEDLIVTNSNSDRALQGMEVTMLNIVNVIAQKHFINIPGNFSFLIAKLLYIYNEYKSRFSHWAEENRELIKAAKETMRREYVSESMIMDEINSLAVTNLETGLPDIVSIIMSLLLSRYNTDLNRNKIFGIIICHGYSTATSIASAVNSLIGSYVFDSIDMPINTTVDEIRDILRKKLTRINSYADVVILVDMGSLEEIIQNNEFIGNRNVGIINNVSTKMALSIGYKIKSGCSIEAVFDQADQDYKVEYAIVKARQRDMILFTSESGLQTSQRMVNLFRDSLPREIPVEFLIVPFEKMMEGNIVDIVNSGNVLMIIGTEDPGLTVAPFIPLESLVATSNLDLISHKLSGYLDEASVQQLTFNIRRNFTLINIVNYLTILNPKPLLDAITESVEILQQKMNIRLDGKRLVGIYIHVCILVERLVTKTGLIEHDNATAEFVSQHSDFIQKAKESFSQVEQHYNIMIPEAEMKYLYAFLSKENRED